MSHPAIPPDESTDLPWLPWLLQTADALFPTGAYAHSLGFEECVRLGLVREEISLTAFLREHIAPAQQLLELPYLRFAWEAETLDALCAVDEDISAWKLPREAREASLQLGGRRLAALRNIYPDSLLSSFETAIREGRARGHHLAVCGWQSRLGGVPLRAALLTYFYQSMAAICAAAMKLMRLGQDSVQRALRTACAEAPRVVEESLSVTRENAGCFDPLLEIASMRHERAEERLFIS